MAISECFECLYKGVCSDERKQRHEGNCKLFEKTDSSGWSPGGSPPRKFCPICIHEPEECISTVDINRLSKTFGRPVEEIEKIVFEGRNAVLSEYEMIEGQCMIKCNRFVEKE